MYTAFSVKFSEKGIWCTWGHAQNWVNLNVLYLIIKKINRFNHRIKKISKQDIKKIVQEPGQHYPCPWLSWPRDGFLKNWDQRYFQWHYLGVQQSNRCLTGGRVRSRLSNLLHKKKPWSRVGRPDQGPSERQVHL